MYHLSLLKILLFYLMAALMEATSLSGFSSLLNTYTPASKGLRLPFRYLTASLGHIPGYSYVQATESLWGIWGMVAVFGACLLQVHRMRRVRVEDEQELSIADLKETGKHGQRVPRTVSSDPGLLRKHSTFKSYTTSIATYPSIRTFYHPHPQADKLPKNPPLPLLVFIHGLGGSLAQFHPLLTSLVNIGPVLGVDLPGCGLSRFAPRSWEAYSHKALVELLDVIITQYHDQDADQGIILVGHSMGCSLAVSLSSYTSSYNGKHKSAYSGLIAICPLASVPKQEQVTGFQKLLSIPTPVFDLWRRWDRRGGTESTSVKRFVGKDADLETKRLQEKFNTESRTAVWRRMAWGALPNIHTDGTRTGGLPGPDVWAALSLPIFAIAGEDDHVTKPEELSVIGVALGRAHKPSINESGSEVLQQSAAPDPQKAVQDGASSVSLSDNSNLGLSSTASTTIRYGSSFNSEAMNNSTSSAKKPNVFKATILPSPATHALLYDHATYRTLAGLIQTFLAEHIDSRLSLGWQLQHLATEGKWDVKNLAKWQAVKPVSEPIGAVFRAMKTLREIDESHSPAIFVKEWKAKIKAVIDISHDSPVYNPQGLDDGGIQYHKFPTISKIPPTIEEVRDFIALVDRLRAASTGDDPRLIGVHCHYGFNRTGFFICSYLVEREHFTVQQAIDEFERQRPPGIRHEHFLDTLFVRNCKGLKRAPTL